jgi:hypothetical protein
MASSKIKSKGSTFRCPFCKGKVELHSRNGSIAEAHTRELSLVHVGDMCPGFVQAECLRLLGAQMKERNRHVR